jgi:hypothetical protein
LASPASIREVRVHVTDTFHTSHANAGADGDWNVSNADIHKLRAISVDVSGLTQPGIEDGELQTRMHAKPAMIAGLAKGSLKFSTYAGGAYANVDVGPEWNVARACAGGVQPPTTSRSIAAGAAVDTVNVNLTGVESVASIGMAALIGVRGDGRGGAEVKTINAVDTDHIGLSIATAAAATTSDNVTFSTVIYPDEDATQHYLDALIVGHASADQIQTIGGGVTFGLSGAGIGELPTLDFDVAVADWQHAPSGSRASLLYGTDPRGGDPAFHRGTGIAHIGDHGSSTRTAYKATDWTFSPGISYAEIPSVSGINGVGGHQHLPGSPTMECTIITAEDDGLIDDFPDTAKAVLLQLGSAPRKCIAIELPKCYLTERPQRVEVNNLTGWRLKFRGTEDYVSGNDLRSAAWRIHIF